MQRVDVSTHTLLTMRRVRRRRQPILITLADDLNVSYEEVTSIPTLVQASYAAGLLFITPLGDLVRRRQLVLTCVASAAILSLILALVPTLRAFQAISVSRLSQRAPRWSPCRAPRHRGARPTCACL